MDQIFKIEPLTERHQTAFDQILQEYLPGSEPKIVHAKVTQYPETCLVAVAKKGVLGIAFGWPRQAAMPEKEYCLDGIAVTYEYWRRGIGSRLLEAFEKAAAGYGYDKLSVGSAGGFVEKFYLKNGYQPQCFKIYEEGRITVRKEFSSVEEFEKCERTEEGFVVFVKCIKQC